MLLAKLYITKCSIAFDLSLTCNCRKEWSYANIYP